MKILLSRIFRSLGFSLLISITVLAVGVGVGAQDESAEDDVALIVYECENGFGIRNLCVVQEDGSDQRQITFAQFSNQEFYNPSVNAHGQIAHVCEVVSERFDICVINADGSGFRRTTYVSPHANNFGPDINDHGAIAFKCSDQGTPAGICLVEPGGGEARRLEIDVAVSVNPNVQIDNEGRILFQCVLQFSTEDLCMINDDGTNLTHVTQVESRGESNTSASMNEHGQVVFQCDAASTGQGICRVDLETLEVKPLIKSSENRGVFSPQINDSGQIAFSCKYSGFSMDLCAGGWNEGFVARLTAEEGRYFRFAKGLTERGTIAHECLPYFRFSNLCTISIDGTNSTQLTFLNKNEINSEPVINDRGQIVFLCKNGDGTSQVCFINDLESDAVNLSERFGIELVFDVDMNDHGVIAMRCQLPEGGDDLCVIDLGSDSFSVLTDHPDVQGTGALDPSINNNNLIAYRCLLSYDSNICTSTADGTERKILTKAGDNEDFFSASINDNNQIVFACEFESLVRNVCLIDLEKNLSHVTTDASRHEILYNSPVISNAGRVSVNCSESTEIESFYSVCSVNSDGTDFVNHGADSTGSFVTNESAINDENVVVYACPSAQDGSGDICVLTPDNDGSWTESRIVWNWSAVDPSINDRSEVTFRCTDIQGNRNICYHNLSTGESQQLTFLNQRGEVGEISSQ